MRNMEEFNFNVRGTRNQTSGFLTKFHFSVAWSDLQLGLAEKSEFVLPSGQQITKEMTLPPDLAIINQRIEVIFSFMVNAIILRGSSDGAVFFLLN